MVLASVTLLPAFSASRGTGSTADARAAAPHAARAPALDALGRARHRATPRRTPSAARCCCSPWPHRCSRSAWASPTTGRMPEQPDRTPGLRPGRRRASAPGANGPLVIAVDISRDPSVVDPLAAAVAADRGHRLGRASRRRPRDRASRPWSRIPTTAPQDDATTETIARLRARRPPGGARRTARRRAHVGGQTATFADLGDRVRERLPRFVAAVLLLSFLLLIAGVPVGAGAAEGGAAEPAEHRRGVRRAGHGLPVGLGRRT